MQTQKQSLTKYIQAPEKLQLLILSGTEIPLNQLDGIFQCVNLIKLDLSNNLIQSLQKMGDFHNLVNLRILYLHCNQFETVQSLNPIFNMSSLNYLSVYQNPISSSKNLRHQIVQQLTNLWGMDFNTVSDEERYESLFYCPNRYQVNGPNTKLNWPIINYHNDNKNQDNSTDYEKALIILVWKELDKIRTHWENGSALLCIQRNFRGALARKLTCRMKKINEDLDDRIRLVIRHWRKYTLNKIDIQQFLLQDFKKKFIGLKQSFGTQRKEKLKRLITIKSFKMIYKFLKSFTQAIKRTMESLKVNKYHKLYIQKDQISMFFILINRISDKALKYGQHGINIIQKDKAIKKAIEQMSTTVYDPSDFPRTYKIYRSQIKTYRIPYSFQFLGDNYPNYRNPSNMMHAPAYAAKLCYQFLTKRALVINRKSKKELAHQYPFLEQFQKSNLLMKKLIKFQLTQNQQQKMIRVQQQIDNFQQNEYNQLYEINIPCTELMREIVKFTWKLNCLESKDLFLLYFEYPVMQSAAALKIQKCYKRYILVKTNKLSIYDLLNKIKEKKSIMVIQSWTRRVKSNNRQVFFKELSFRLKSIKTDQLFIQVDSYLSLTRIVQQQSIKFIEQENEIYVQNQTIKAVFSDKAFQGFQLPIADLELLKKKKLIPIWILQQQTDLNTPDQFLGDIYHIIHLNSTCSTQTINGIKWMCFSFASINEARLRYSLLALCTYQFKGQSYIQFYTKKEINYSNQEQKTWLLNSLNKATQNFQLPQFSLEGQDHGDKFLDNTKAIFIGSKSIKDISFKSFYVQVYTQPITSKKSKPSKKFSAIIKSVILVGLTSSLYPKSLDSFIDEGTQCQMPSTSGAQRYKYNGRMQTYGDIGNITNLTTESGVNRLFTKINLDYTLDNTFNTEQDESSTQARFKTLFSQKTRPQAQVRSQTVSNSIKPIDQSNYATNEDKSYVTLNNFQTQTLQTRYPVVVKDDKQKLKQIQKDKMILQQFIQDKEKMQNYQMVRLFKEKQIESKKERQLEQSIILGSGQIGKYNQMFMHNKDRQQDHDIKRQNVMSRQLQSNQSKVQWLTQQKVLKSQMMSMEQNSNKSNIREERSKSLHCYPPRQTVKYSRLEKDKQATNKFLHAVFPEEIYPINKGGLYL